MKVIWLLSARRQLEEILAYISTDSPQAAERYVDDLFDRANEMLEFPEIGTIYNVSGKKIVRKLALDRHKFILYRKIDDAILILNLRDSRTDWKKY